jgi:hypothetical protein
MTTTREYTLLGEGVSALMNQQSSQISQACSLGGRTSKDDRKGLVRILFRSSQGRRES